MEGDRTSAGLIMGYAAFPPSSKTRVCNTMR